MSSAIAERRSCKRFSFHNRFASANRIVYEDWQWRHTEECGSYEKNFDVPFSTVLRKALRDYPTISVDANVLSGTPRISGTRIPVYMIVDAVEYSGSIEGALRSYSNLTREQVKDALSFAVAVLEHPVEHESETATR